MRPVLLSFGTGFVLLLGLSACSAPKRAAISVPSEVLELWEHEMIPFETPWLVNDIHHVSGALVSVELLNRTPEHVDLRVSSKTEMSDSIVTISLKRGEAGVVLSGVSIEQTSCRIVDDSDFPDRDDSDVRGIVIVNGSDWVSGDFSCHFSLVDVAGGGLPHIVCGGFSSRGGIVVGEVWRRRQVRGRTPAGGAGE